MSTSTKLKDELRIFTPIGQGFNEDIVFWDTVESGCDESYSCDGVSTDSRPTIKLEGAKANGYHTIFLGAVRDPILIQQFDSWIESIETYVKERINAFGYEHDLKIHKYGINGVMGPLEPDASVDMEVSIAGQVRAATQDRADEVASMAKFGLTHPPYAGQLVTAGKRSVGVAFHTLRDPDGSMPGVLCVPHHAQG
ncbi:hypothetical protein LTR67_009901 [Exophiala xenobiotica]